MLDMYSEKLVRRKPSTKTIVLKAAIATLTMFLAYLVFYIFSSSLQLIGFMPIAVAAIIFVGWKAFTFFNTEYEYTVTNGSLDIDKIVAKKSRKRLCTVLAKNIETLAPYTPDYRGAYDTGAFKETIDARSDEIIGRIVPNLQNNVGNGDAQIDEIGGIRRYFALRLGGVLLRDDERRETQGEYDDEKDRQGIFRNHKRSIDRKRG